MQSKYYRIYKEIVSQIEQGIYQPNDLLPSEKSLIDNYQVSRDTIRKALAMLEQNGYIQKAKGKGSFVLNPKKLDFSVSGVVSFKEINQRMGRNFKTFVEELSCQPATKKLQKDLSLKSDDLIWKVVRTRKIDGEKIILDKDFIVQKYVDGLTEAICEDSLYDYIENQLGLKISYANKEITMQMATDEDRKYLDLKQYDMVAVVQSYTYLNDTRLFQYTESRHRPDKFIFVNFARR